MSQQGSLNDRVWCWDAGRSRDAHRAVDPCPNQSLTDRPRLHRRLRLACGHSVASTLLLIACVASLAAQSPETGSAVAAPPTAQPARSWVPLAVAGFDADEKLDARDTWMPTAVAETLAWRLRRVPGLTVVPTTRLHQSRQELAEKADDPPAEWSRVVPLTGAKLWLRGTCAGTPYQTLLDLELIRVGEPASTSAKVHLGPGRLFEVIDDATRWVLGQLGVSRIERTVEKLIFAPPASSPTALEYYAKALAAARREDLRDAGYYAQRAVDADPHASPAVMLLAKLELRSAAPRLAEAYLRHTRILAADREDTLTEVELEVTLGLALIMERSFEPARRRFETALDLARQRDDPYGQLAAMNCLCDYWLNSPPPAENEPTGPAAPVALEQNLRRAAEWEARALDLLAALGDHVATAPGANKLALIYERLNEPELALRAHQRTIAAARQCGSARTEATACLFLGQWYRRQEHWDEALEAITRCLALAPDEAKPAVRISLAEVYRGMSKPREALEQHEAAYAALVDGDDLSSQFQCLHAIAELRMELGQRDGAIAKLAEALEIAELLDLPEAENLGKQLAQWKAQEAP